MKNILKIALFALLGLVLVTGCKKDDEENSSNQNSTEILNHLVGRWECTYSNQFYDGENHTGVWEGKIWEFSNDGRLIIQLNDNTETFVFSLSGNTIIVKDYLGQVLTKAEIKQLTGNTLELYYADPNSDRTEEYRFRRLS